MNPSERRQELLSRALRELAQDSPQGAPEELGLRLSEAFRLHHRRRRVLHALAAVGVAASLLLGITVLMSHRKSSPPVIVRQPRQIVPTEPDLKERKLPVADAPRPVVVVGANRTVRPRTDQRTVRKAPHAEETDTARFVALPIFDPDVPVGQSRVVRLELPGSALRLVGYPVDEELSERRVVTDVLLSQDGTPYAVRLVRTRAVR